MADSNVVGSLPAKISDAAPGLRIGIDLGGTKIEGIVMTPTAALLVTRRIDTPQGGYADIVAAVADMITALEADAGETCRIGVGMPGAVSPSTDLIKNSNTTCLNGRPFHRDLMTRIGRPILFENDANCFALSEAWDGAAAGCDSVFGVIIGTGTGGGLVVGRRVLRGANAIGGEWGHNPLAWPTPAERDNPACYCGRRGCLETYLSGAGLSRSYHEMTGERLSAAAVAALANAGDAAANAVLATYEDRLARGLAMVINIMDPEVIVLGGGLSNIDRLYETVPPRLARYVFSDHIATRLCRARFGASSGVRGAARLWD